MFCEFFLLVLTWHEGITRETTCDTSFIEFLAAWFKTCLLRKTFVSKRFPPTISKHQVTGHSVQPSISLVCSLRHSWRDLFSAAHSFVLCNVWFGFRIDFAIFVLFERCMLPESHPFCFSSCAESIVPNPFTIAQPFWDPLVGTGFPSKRHVPAICELPCPLQTPRPSL